MRKNDSVRDAQEGSEKVVSKWWVNVKPKADARESCAFHDGTDGLIAGQQRPGTH
jgi:hypothetical protein